MAWLHDRLGAASGQLLRCSLMVSALCLSGQASLAETSVGAPAATVSSTPLAAPRKAVTHHQGVFNGVAVRYVATVEDNFVDSDTAGNAATIITTAYCREGVAAAKRPVLFIFNGGPGASSSPLHFGALGPVKRMEKAKAAEEPRPGPLWQANPHSILDAADLVFIDPVGTGFSRVLAKTNPTYWYNSHNDAIAIKTVIARWLKQHGRESSPRYLVGESYGTARVGYILKSGGDPAFDGIVLIALVGDTPGNEMPFVASLPTYAAAAWYHERIARGGRTVQQVYDEANAFAQSDYASALIRGASLPQAEKARIAARMSSLIGLPAGFIEAHDLRIDPSDFMFTLLKDKGLRTGMLDTRVTAVLEPGAEGAIDDPALGVAPKRKPGDDKPIDVAAIGAIPNPALKAYLNNVLKFPSDETYAALNFAANAAWKHENFADATGAIGHALSARPSMRALWFNGLYDLSTPAAAGRYSLDHAGVPAGQLTAVLFEGPHGVYDGEQNLIAFSAALRRFVQGR